MCLHSTSSFRSHGKQLEADQTLSSTFAFAIRESSLPAVGAALDSRPQPGASVAWGGDGMPGILRAPHAAPRALSEVLNAEGSWRAGSEWARVSIVASNCEHLRGDGRVWGSGEARAVSASPIISLKCLDSYSTQYLAHFQDHHLSPPLHHRFLQNLRASLPLQSMHKFRRLSPGPIHKHFRQKFIPLRISSPRVNTKIKYLKPSSTPISHNFL